MRDISFHCLPRVHTTHAALIRNQSLTLSQEFITISSTSHKAKKRKTRKKRLNPLVRKFVAGFFTKFTAFNQSRGVAQSTVSPCWHVSGFPNPREIPPGSHRVDLSYLPKTASTIVFGGEEKTAEGRTRVWRDIRIRAKEAGSKKAEALRGMIPGRPRNTFSPWNLTPESSPRHTPIPSDLDSDDERDNMENWHASRPISLALSRPTLDEVLANQAAPPYTLTAFMAYLSQNHCLETLEFTMDSKRYWDNYMSVARQTNEIPIMSDTPQAANLCMLWQRLLSAYIVPGAPREINLPSAVRDALLRHVNARRPPHPETLDSAVKRMRDLMDESIFIPFLNSRAVQPPPPPQPRRLNEGISLEETTVNRRISMRQRLSPQSSFVSPRSTTSGYFSYNTTSTTSTTTSQGSTYAPSRSNTTRNSPHGYASCDSGSGSLTDDTGSLPPSPGSCEPMTPPTTPPSSDLHSPKHRSENTWKKMGMKLGFKKRPPGGSGGGSSSGGATPKTSDDR